MDKNLTCMTMELPALNGIIDRRILINYRVDPDLLSAQLPDHLQPLVVNGYASAGTCLLRLKNIGLKHTPTLLRITSENAAHRYLVTFKKDNRPAVYIPRRDTDSVLNVTLAGKIFSWPHFPADFQVIEKNNLYEITMQSKDGYAGLQVKAELTDTFPHDSMFDSITHASACFQRCAIGISPSTKGNHYKTIQLKTKRWAVNPLQIHSLKSTYFEDHSRFPVGTIHFDNALLMEDIEHEWLKV